MAENEDAEEEREVVQSAIVLSKSVGIVAWANGGVCLLHETVRRLD